MKHIHGGLNEIGTDLSQVTLDDLQPVDEFHRWMNSISVAMPQPRS